MNRMTNIFFALMLVVIFTACNDDEETTVEQVEKVPLSNLDQWESGNDIMMQSFFWDVPSGGNWWMFIEDEVDDWAAIGVDRIWLPQFAKSASGGYSMGYDPADYFDLGEYEQYGTVETRFGSKDELLSLINTIHENDMEVIADIVINHNGGGALEISGYDNNEYYTLFTPEAGTNMSGRFNRNWTCFKPYDEGYLFYNDKNLDLNNSYVRSELWENKDAVAKYYVNELGIDGWRFDYVKGYSPEVNRAWNEATGNLYSVGENWDGNVDVLEEWVNQSGSKVFDFAAFYNMEKAFDSQRDLTYLLNESLLHRQPEKAVAFVSNHDTEKDENTENKIDLKFKQLAYAYILTHADYNCLFYSDYEENMDKEEIQKLIKINKTIAAGDLEILYANKYEYIARRNGNDDNPGLIVYINISSGAKTHMIHTNWEEGTEIYDYSDNSLKYLNQNVAVGINGFAEITVAPNSYAVWSVK